MKNTIMLLALILSQTATASNIGINYYARCGYYYQTQITLSQTQKTTEKLIYEYSLLIKEANYDGYNTDDVNNIVNRKIPTIIKHLTGANDAKKTRLLNRLKKACTKIGFEN